MSAVDSPIDPIAGGTEQRTTAAESGRGTKAAIRPRGWLVRRALLAADVAGLVIAAAVAELVFHGGGSGVLEDLFFAGTIPGWIVMAKLYGLYDRDEERTDHST